MLYHAKERTLMLRNGPMKYIAFGNGSKPLIMIQGLSTRGIEGMAISLAIMYRIFAKEYKVYFFDRRKAVKEGITINELADDLAEAMDLLKIACADVVGVSQGGMIAQALAIERPDLVRKLVLAVTLARNNETVVAVINGWIDMVKQNKMKTLVADMLDKMYSERYQNRYRRFLPLLTILQTPKDPQRFLALAQACFTCDTYDQLDQIQCPVLVIGGRKDKVVGVEGSVEIAEKLGCELFLYEEGGHALYEEAPDFNQRVYDFLQE